MRFTFGQHRGLTFKEVAFRDPGYHVRYMYVLRKEGEYPFALFAAYIIWFEKTNSERNTFNTKNNGGESDDGGKLFIDIFAFCDWLGILLSLHGSLLMQYI